MKARFSQILTLMVLLVASLVGQADAQELKIGYYESDFVLSQIPEYAGIEQRLKLLSDGWEAELDELNAEIRELEEDFQAKEILYTDEIRKQKRAEIQQKKQQRDAYLNQKFGPQGEYFTRQKELLEPIQRQVFTAVRAVAQRQGFDYVFDRTGDVNIVYARSEWNLNEDILLELGIEMEERN